MTRNLTHWQFSFLLHTCNLGDSARTGTDPFTGEPVSFPIDDGLNDAEIEALQELFEEHGIEGPEPDYEGYAVYAPDGGSLRFRCHDLEDSEPVIGISVEIVVKELSDPLIRIILEAAKAGNCVLTSAVGDEALIVDRSPAPAVLERWPDVEQISRTAELRNWIENVIGGQKVIV